jgi:EAL domain-containing protein (putative c-di-GMP-specific phosphodiesterase class I)
MAGSSTLEPCIYGGGVEVHFFLSSETGGRTATPARIEDITVDLTGDVDDGEALARRSAMRARPSSARRPSEVLRRMLALARDHLELEAAAVWQFAGSQRVRRFEVGAGIGAGPDDPQDRVQDIPITSSDGHPLGILSCRWGAQREASARDLQFLHMVAQIASSELELEAREDSTRRARRQRIRQAIRSRGMSMVFQPIVGLFTMETVGFEALARFRGRPARGPEWWFAEAEAVGLKTSLELTAIRAALDQVEALPTETWLSVNASPSTVMAPAFADAIAARSPERVIVELTEHAQVHEYLTLAKVLEPLRHLGVRLAIDDAGAGFSTFRHILNLEPDLIKLDIALTRRIDADASRRALASALVSYAGQVGSQLVAEGIESRDELQALRELGVRYGQGRYLGAPMPLEAAVGPSHPRAAAS